MTTETTATDDKQTQQTEKTVELKLGSQKVSVSEEFAKSDAFKAITSYRDSYNGKLEELNSTKAKLAEYEQAANKIKQEQQKALEKTVPTEQLEQIKKALEEKHKTELSAVTSKLEQFESQVIRSKVEAIVNKNKDIAPTAVADVTDLANAKYKFRLDSAGELEVLSDGKPLLSETGDPIKAEALVAKIVSDRPHFKKFDGAQPTNKSRKATEDTATKIYITEAEFDKKTRAGEIRGPDARKYVIQG